jgi:hypothetical protein
MGLWDRGLAVAGGGGGRNAKRTGFGCNRQLFQEVGADLRMTGPVVPGWIVSLSQPCVQNEANFPGCLVTMSWVRAAYLSLRVKVYHGGA